MKPVAWQSSTIVTASYFAASASMSFSFAKVPSIENTPSVATMMNRAPSARACFSCRSRSSMSELA